MSRLTLSLGLGQGTKLVLSECAAADCWCVSYEYLLPATTKTHHTNVPCSTSCRCSPESLVENTGLRDWAPHITRMTSFWDSMVLGPRHRQGALIHHKKTENIILMRAQSEIAGDSLRWPPGRELDSLQICLCCCQPQQPDCGPRPRLWRLELGADGAWQELGKIQPDCLLYIFILLRMNELTKY